jgi:hypothetical protein
MLNLQLYSLRGKANRVYVRNPDLTVDDLLIEAELEESVKREAPRIEANVNAIPNAPRQRFDGGCFLLYDIESHGNLPQDCCSQGGWHVEGK